MSKLIKKIEHALNASESNLMTDVLNDCLETLSDEWISVDDRLPNDESGYNVRVYCHDIVNGWQQDLLFNKKAWVHDGGKEFEPIVTHWKPHSKNPK